MDQLIRKNEELGTILEISSVLTQSFDLEQNLFSVMRILSNRLQLQRGCVFLLQSNTLDNQIVSAYGLTRQEIKRGKYRIGEGIVGKVIETGEPMVVPIIMPPLRDRASNVPLLTSHYLDKFNRMHMKQIEISDPLWQN
jgi:Nif-specific regulatory protein